MAKEKADLLDLRADNIKVELLDKRFFSGMVYVNAKMFVSYNNNVITFSISDDLLVDQGTLEHIIENQVAHCKNQQIGVYGREVLAPGPNVINAMALEMYLSFTDYFTSKLHVDAFGRDSFESFQKEGMGTFLKLQKKALEESFGEEQKIPFIFAYYKEQVKSNFIEDYESGIPNVINRMIAPLPNIFEMIDNVDSSWIDKTTLLFCSTLFHTNYVLVCDSYDSGDLVVRKEPRKDILNYLISYNYLSRDLLKEAEQINEYMSFKYYNNFH